ncbi:putative acyl-activating enzyme 17, peroxisomal, partial [Turnera subulata]
TVGDAAQQTTKVIEGAKPLASSTVETISTADPLTPAQALDSISTQNHFMIDIRSEKDKDKAGIPRLPSSAKNRMVAIPLEELPSKLRGLVRNVKKVEAEIAALKISYLKKINKGTNIVILDSYSDSAKIVARTLTSLGFKNCWIVADGFSGSKGWLQSRLGTDSYNLSFAEILRPSQIIPAATRRFGTTSSNPAPPPGKKLKSLRSSFTNANYAITIFPDKIKTQTCFFLHTKKNQIEMANSYYKGLDTISVSDIEALGVSSDAARKLYREVSEIVAAHGPASPETWTHISKRVLNPGLPFSFHQMMYYGCYKDFGPDPPAWLPDPKSAVLTNVGHLLERRGKEFLGSSYKDPISSFSDFQEFSVSNPEVYWRTVFEEMKISFSVPPQCILRESPPGESPLSNPGGQWLPGAILNPAKNCLTFNSKRNPDHIAIRWRDEGNDHLPVNSVTLEELRSDVWYAGLERGSAIAIDMPMNVKSVVIYLAIVLAGYAVVSIADSFAPVEISTRLRISNAKAIFTQDLIIRGDKSIPLYSRVVDAQAPMAIVIPTKGSSFSVKLRNGDISWHDFLERMNFVLLNSQWKHLQISFSHLGLQDAGVTMLGVIPSIVRTWKTANCTAGYDWSAIRCFGSTGEASSVDEYLWLMGRANYKPIIEYCGGTEIGGGFISGSLLQPQALAAFSTPAMGCRLFILGDDGHPTNAPGMGELALGPHMFGASHTLLNADHYKILRRHGDVFERTSRGYYHAHGRADDTMNLGGIKVSSVEIERICNAADSHVLETAAIGVPPPQGGPEQLVIVVVLKDAQNSTVDLDKLRKSFNSAVQKKLNPLFKVSSVVPLSALPRTATNKVMRRVLRQQFVQQNQKSKL